MKQEQKNQKKIEDFKVFKQEKLSVVSYIVPEFKNKENSWPNAWFGILETIGIQNIEKTRLNEIFYSSRWIRERYLTLHNEKLQSRNFDDHQLVRTLSGIIEPLKYKFLPYLIASITGKSINNIHLYFFNERNNINIKNAVDDIHFDNNVKNKLLELFDELDPLISSKISIHSLDLFSVKKLIEKLEEKQNQNEPFLLQKLCEESFRIRKLHFNSTGGYVIVNTIDNTNIPKFTVRFFFTFLDFCCFY